MGIFDAFKNLGGKKPSEDAVEFPEEGEPKEKLTVRIESVNGLGDVERIAAYVRQGNVVLIKLRELQKKDVGLFQTSLQKMKRLSSQFNWDIVALPEGYVIITPNFVRIERPEA
ncbi:MAG: cell division protein SepF [Candidatus Aenigmarchaeota archaeon]|nr:cell division protein SepF [Candidatus Aenigmarchaeota archaeon]